MPVSILKISSIWLLLYYTLLLTSRSQAVVVLSPSCDPFRSVLEQALEETREMAHKAMTRLLAGPERDVDAAQLYKVFFGTKVGPRDPIS